MPVTVGLAMCDPVPGEGGGETRGAGRRQQVKTTLQGILLQRSKGSVGGRRAGPRGGLDGRCHNLFGTDENDATPVNKTMVWIMKIVQVF